LDIFTEMVKLPPVTFFLMDQEKKCKIVVFGAFGAGKTTLIRTLDPASSHVEAMCSGGTTTVALDYGRVQLNGTHIHIFGTPGQERFEFAREIIGRGMDGAILLVDATSPVNDFIHHLYDSLSASRIPFVIFLNKCDCISAHPASIQMEFADAHIIKVSALDRQQSLEALSAFAYTLSPHHNGH
jgi:small GTP-binding protein